MSKNVNKLVNNFWEKIVDDLSSEEKKKLVKFKLPKEKCQYCGTLNASWYNILFKEYACDTCVPRGCSCKLKRKERTSGLHIQDYVYLTDKQGRELPCEDWSKL